MFAQAQTPFTPEQLAQLEQPLDPNHVKYRQGGGGSQLALKYIRNRNGSCNLARIHFLKRRGEDD